MTVREVHSPFWFLLIIQLIYGNYFRQIVHRLNDFWSSCAQLRSQLLLLSIKYPVEIVANESEEARLPGFKAKVMVMFPSVKAKAFISFLFSFGTLSQWPISINTLDCEVDVAYGPVE